VFLAGIERFRRCQQIRELLLASPHMLRSPPEVIDRQLLGVPDRLSARTRGENEHVALPDSEGGSASVWRTSGRDGERRHEYSTLDNVSANAL
jgi:hypothetical protein